MGLEIVDSFFSYKMKSPFVLCCDNPPPSTPHILCFIMCLYLHRMELRPKHFWHNPHWSLPKYVCSKLKAIFCSDKHMHHIITWILPYYAVESLANKMMYSAVYYRYRHIRHLHYGAANWCNNCSIRQEVFVMAHVQKYTYTCQVANMYSASDHCHQSTLTPNFPNFLCNLPVYMKASYICHCVM